MTRSFARSLDSLDEICGYVQEFLDGTGLSSDLAMELDLVIEELFSNMVKYSPDGDPTIDLGLEHNDGRLVITIVETGVKAFDPTRAPEVDINAGIEERTPGGLGIHFVRRIADEFTYRFDSGTATTTVVKKTGSGDV